jgi:hypothetical protein
MACLLIVSKDAPEPGTSEIQLGIIAKRILGLPGR